jgi:hypothetical protein
MSVYPYAGREADGTADGDGATDGEVDGEAESIAGDGRLAANVTRVAARTMAAANPTNAEILRARGRRHLDAPRDAGVTRSLATASRRCVGASISGAAASNF